MIVYAPNAAESQWSWYILQNHLGVQALALNNDAINVSGGSAVSFLSLSGLPMNVLKVIWDVADPEGYGTLLHM